MWTTSLNSRMLSTTGSGGGNLWHSPSSNGGVNAQWTAKQLLDLGLSPADLRARAKAGALVRLRRGHYAIGSEASPEAEHLRLMRATALDVAQSSVFSHTSAAVLHGLPVDETTLGVATMIRTTPGHGNGSPQLRVRNTSLLGDHITVVDGFSVTTLERTLCDLARLSPLEWGVAAVDAGLRRGADPAEIRRILALHPRLQGVHVAKRVMAFADPRSESAAESLSRVQMRRWGLPEPHLQFEVIDADGVVVARTDFGWPELGLVGEVDGKAKYGRLLKPGQSAEDVIMREKRREQEIRRAGYWIVRWGWAEIVDGRKMATIIEDGLRNALPRAS